jgi:hypothetical protein
MPFLHVVPHPEPQATFTDEQKAVFAKLRGIKVTTEKGGIPRKILDNNLRIVRGYFMSNDRKVQEYKRYVQNEINEVMKSFSSSKIAYIDFTLFDYDNSKESEHRLRTYKPGSILKIGIHGRNDLENDNITDKYDHMQEFKSINDIEERDDIKINLLDLSDDMYNSILELNPSFINNNGQSENKVLKYGKLAAITASLHALAIDGNVIDELKGKSIIFKSDRDYIGDDSENVMLFDFLGHKDGQEGDTADIITEDLDTAAEILHDCIWLINISERGRTGGSSQYDLHTRINITLAFSKCKENVEKGTFYVNGIKFDYTVHPDFSKIIKSIDVDEEGVLQDPKFDNNNSGVDNPGNKLILNRYLGTIARYKEFDDKGNSNEWFKTYLRLIINMSDIEFYEFASEILRNIMIICSQEELGVTLFKMARTRFCAYLYCHTVIDPTFPVNLNIPRFIPIEPLEVETHCNCHNKKQQ